MGRRRQGRKAHVANGSRRGFGRQAVPPQEGRGRGSAFGDAGRVTFRLEGAGDSQRVPKHRVGYLPEERGLYKEARILDVLLFLASIKGMPKDEARRKALDWLERFGLGAYANAKVEELSKG